MLLLKINATKIIILATLQTNNTIELQVVLNFVNISWFYINEKTNHSLVSNRIKFDYSEETVNRSRYLSCFHPKWSDLVWELLELLTCEILEVEWSIIKSGKDFNLAYHIK